MHPSRRRRPAQDVTYDVTTPTPEQARRADLARRRRRYGVLMGLCLTLVVFGFFVPAPVPVRLVVLAVAAVLPPMAAIAGNGGPRG